MGILINLNSCKFEKISKHKKSELLFKLRYSYLLKEDEVFNYLKEIEKYNDLSQELKTLNCFS